ncbi:hypothetical protein [Salicola sp. Rm-C-2C1-2]|uniref:hypothetical protein n=1 Tax=Salicola sp. Rm-C-2C1-2 TaxID=3141321 RepID=UPI0032E522FE
MTEWGLLSARLDGRDAIAPAPKDGFTAVAESSPQFVIRNEPEATFSAPRTN